MIHDQLRRSRFGRRQLSKSFLELNALPLCPDSGLLSQSAVLSEIRWLKALCRINLL